MEKRFIISGACIYLAYFTHGMQAIVISQLCDQFIVQWNTDLAGIMNVIAFTGLAKLLSVWICGEISDKIGRKKMIIIGASMYIIFFGGLFYTHNYTLACIFAFFAGAATSFFDGSCYPAVQENFPKAPGTALVLIKGFVASSGMLYPLLIGYLHQNGGSMSLAVILPLLLSVLILVLALFSPFAYDEELAKIKKIKNKKTLNTAPASDLTLNKSASAVSSAPPTPPALPATMVSKPKFAVEGCCCLLYGGIAMMTFYLIQQVTYIYGKDVIGLSEMSARALMTYYNAGSLIAVLLAGTIMAKGVRPLAVLFFYTIGSLASLLLMYYIRIPSVTMVSTFCVGFFAAGGALQSGLAVFGEFFPNKKGRNLGMYFSFMGCAAYLGPKICALLLDKATYGLTKGSVEYLAAEVVGKTQFILFDVGIAVVGFLIMLILTLRYKAVFGVSPFKRKVF